ncbi:MAG TPA: sortase [Candidatus Limnocylindrales bacterium]|nr:sortase [Candidatus Limnocylindrales bacterium]
MKRLSSWALPIILGVVGVALIIIGTLDLDAEPTASLPPIATATPTQVAEATPTPEPSASASPSSSVEPTEQPTPSPLPSNVTAVQLGVPSVGINVAVKHSNSAETDGFPPSDAAYILQAGQQPGRNMNSYIFAHAINSLFKPLWNVQVGAEVLVRMSDESVLRYIVTEVRPNVPCPDPNADPANNPEAFGVVPPLALQIHDDCDQGAFWTVQTDYERLTLQTSQGYNRNWGELVIIAEPDRS